MDTWEVLAYLAVAALLVEAVAVVRRGARQLLGYLALLGGNLGLMAWILDGERFSTAAGAPTVELVGGLAACGLLVVVPRLLEALARRALTDERYDRAARLFGFKEVLVPGAASAAERRFYEQIAAARDGRSDAVIAELRRDLVDAEPPLDEAIQERIVTILLFARRWHEAVRQFETHFSRDPVRVPVLSVQMVRAYGALGDVEAAARLLHRVEERLDPTDPPSSALLLQGRLQLLAQAGAVDEVTRLLAEPALRRLPPRLRDALLATAREKSRTIEKAADPSAAAALPEAGAPEPAPDEGAGPAPPLAAYLDAVALRAAGDVRLAGAPSSRRPPPATLALIAANLAGFALFAILLGDADTGDHLVRGGASFHPAVRAGEWWRLVTALFLHAGPLHLFFNLYGLYLLGRIVEPVIGTARFLVVYGGAGLCGNVASALNPAPAAVFSLGASGAVLGVMSALVVTLLLRPAVWPEGWRREVLVRLAVLLVIQVAILGSMRDVDNLAHLGGLAAGGLLGWLLAPGGLLGRGRLPRVVVGALLALLAAASASSVWALVHEDPIQTMDRLPRLRARLGGIAVVVPAGTEPRHDPDDGDVLAIHALGAQLSAWVVTAGAGTAAEALHDRMVKDTGQVADELRELHKEGHVEGAEPPVAAPAPWTGGAQTVVGAGTRVQLAYYARSVEADPGRVIVVRFLYRHANADALLGEEITRMLATIEIDATPR